MTEKQTELYIRTKERMRRLGKENPADVIVALAEEINYYRDRINSLLDHTRKRGNEAGLVAELRNKQSRDNRDLLDRAADRIEELEAATHKQSEGEWAKQEKIKGKVTPEAVCSNCGREVVYQVIDSKWAFENYCPHCGAKMKGGE